MRRIGRLRKAETGKGTGDVESRLVSVKVRSAVDKWRVVSKARKLSQSADIKDIYIPPNLTRKQADENCGLRMKFREMRLSGEFDDMG